MERRPPDRMRSIRSALTSRRPRTSARPRHARAPKHRRLLRTKRNGAAGNGVGACEPSGKCARSLPLARQISARLHHAAELGRCRHATRRLVFARCRATPRVIPEIQAAWFQKSPPTRATVIPRRRALSQPCDREPSSEIIPISLRDAVASRAGRSLAEPFSRPPARALARAPHAPAFLERGDCVAGTRAARSRERSHSSHVTVSLVWLACSLLIRRSTTFVRESSVHATRRPFDQTHDEPTLAPHRLSYTSSAVCCSRTLPR